MRRYKAVVIDFRRIARRMGSLLLAVLTSATIFLGTGEILMKSADLPEQVLKSNIPVIDTEDGEWRRKFEAFTGKGLTFLLGFVPTKGESVLKATVPVLAAASDSSLIRIANEPEHEPEQNTEEYVPVAEPLPDIPEENRAPIKSIDGAQKISDKAPVAISNETAYSINVADMLSSDIDIDFQAEEPVILITHTHATESYAPTGAEVYDKTASDRSEDKNKNVVAVGRRMKEVFEEKGIKTVHDEILHDASSFNGSYAHSLKAVEEYMEKYPSIQIVFDIHRDSIVYEDKTKAKVVTEINGRKAAQLMFVVGTDANGLYNPNWRSNMKAALHFQTQIAGKYPKLMRYINLRRERFNGHTSGASMIIEVGTSGNSLDEALFSIELAAECIADYLMSL